MGWLYDWQTLIAGGLGLAGGGIAYWGAVRAAKRQVAAADRQVLAIRDQIEDARGTRRQADQRRLSVVEWAVEAEGMRLDASIWALRRALPSEGNRHASRRREQ